MYADDTTLLKNDRNIDLLLVNLISEISNIKDWVHLNKLELNISKQAVIFKNRSVRNYIPLALLDGKIIKQVSHTKILGVRIEENLNRVYHISKTSLKLSKMTGILYRVRYSLTTEGVICIC